MTITFRKLVALAGMTVLLLLAVVSFADASGFGPRPSPGDRPSYSVAEPAAIALLGAGLVSLGIYAKKRRGKKQ
ncbi:MAG TPA: PEP-CTERM sorting domain-containing protein [Candidatus Aminicenantes bacterium]|nr:PEP-CTERM sorting domain-containing protein [Candidatus Aminicenantes bacterium]